ncbi:MAG: hypothetical protein MRY79_02445 [Alphaproteobacteria bacterium]|nr:hypothetical protein [Alphaproteobacteria bacterium]
MAQQGYWVVCEELYAGKNKQNPQKTQEPSMCMGYVEGFSAVEAMGGSRMEVLAVIRRKLRNNIRFLLDCYCDIPPPSYSDNPPTTNNVANAAYLFLGLEEIGVEPELLLTSMAA